MKTIILGTLLITGIILAGSDGPLFPWANLAGVLLALPMVVAGKRGSI